MTTHIGVSVNGILDRLLGKIPKRYGTWQIFTDPETGQWASKEQVWNLVREAKVKGWEVISACDYVDDKGHCKGHEDKK